ncbi:MAG: tRNA lysidine(34) synthetase TilS, partial [Sneathiella sp.]|nr:tRNA lysidine(34) synthetase TilS [Sneathiella sp.]
GIQKGARDARYRLMADFCAGHGIGVLLLGHQMEDQLETVLMRLSKGSGLDGLTGMHASSRRGALRLLRPLLDVRRQTLKDFLSQRQQDWINDPSNENPVFTRTRVGAVLEELRQLPESSLETISLTVARLSRASRALDELAEGKIREICHISPFGFVRFDAAALEDCPDELALRLLTTLFTLVGGGGQRIKLQALENLHRRLFGDASGRSGTLGGCQIVRHGESWLVSREPGRVGLPELDWRPGSASLLWDGRFDVTDTMPDYGLPKERLTVRALGAEGWQIIRELDLTRTEKNIPAKVRNTLPALWSGDRLLAVPLFSCGIPQSFVAKGRFKMVFKSLNS